MIVNAASPVCTEAREAADKHSNDKPQALDKSSRSKRCAGSYYKDTKQKDNQVAETAM